MAPLHGVLCQKYVRVARILVLEGADTSIADDDGKTALHVSAHQGHLIVTELLAGAGTELESSDKDGCTPLAAPICSGDGYTSVITDRGRRESQLSYTHPRYAAVTCGCQGCSLERRRTRCRKSFRKFLGISISHRLSR